MAALGFNIKSVVHDGFKLNVWDIGESLQVARGWNDVLSLT
jgi:hypothetical protein